MKKENGFIKFLLIVITIAFAGILMLFGYVMYNEFSGNENITFGNLKLIDSKIENQEYYFLKPTNHRLSLILKKSLRILRLIKTDCYIST